MGDINDHGGAIIGCTYGFLMTGDGETGKEEFIRDLDKGGIRERTEGGGNTGSKDVH